MAILIQPKGLEYFTQLNNDIALMVVATSLG